MRIVHLDGTQITSKVELLEAVADELDFPDHFGRNWDALEELLRDIEEPTRVVWTDSSRYAVRDPDGFAVAVSIFSATEAVTLQIDA